MADALENTGDTFAKILGWTIIVAIFAVIVSKNSTTSNVLQSAGAFLTNVLGTVVSPISSGTAQQAATNSNGNNAATSPYSPANYATGQVIQSASTPSNLNATSGQNNLSQTPATQNDTAQ